jgi:threonylcarbamoyladenosine tRNA methylthiotransferase MtaB
MKRAFLTTLGCKVNQFETAAFRNQLESNGIQVISELESADLIIVNTCTVTAKAGAESRREVKKMLRKNLQARVVVTGCHAQLAAEELRQLDSVDPGRLIVADNEAKGLLVESIIDGRREGLKHHFKTAGKNRQISGLQVDRFEGRTRAYLRVQDGCDSFCSYCIVPYARGRSRSLPVDQVISQAAAYEKGGHREIVVTGIHIGRYGLDLSENCHIAELLLLLSSRFPTVRFRLSSIEPLEIDDRLLTIMADAENIMPHLHIPLQSGDDSVLAKMNRRYTSRQFKAVVEKCRSTLSDAAIGFDVMVGFPGETEAMFENTRALIDSLDCTYLHVFPYSRRAGTAAADFTQQIDSSTKQRRAGILRRLSDKKSRAFYDRFINARRMVLLESGPASIASGGPLKGFTDNYIPVVVERPPTLPAEPVMAELIEPCGASVRARIIQKNDW